MRSCTSGIWSRATNAKTVMKIRMKYRRGFKSGDQPHDRVYY
jgi:hypothetical protein